MSGLDEYDLFLFDFDGLLVDTERLHMEAYRLLCKRHGCDAEWTFAEYCGFAHRKAWGPRDALYRQFPLLKDEFPDWSVLYAEKQAIYSDLVRRGGVRLMPGAGALLEELEDRGIRHAVVTHSRLDHIDLIRDQHPILQRISNWITREDYSEPKPSPESYLTAASRFACPGDRVVGFEDSPRGFQALVAAGLTAVFVAPSNYPFLVEAVAFGAIHMTSLESVRNTPSIF